MKYVKLNLSFGDKLRMFFFGIIPEDKLPEVVKTVEVQTSSDTKKPERPPLIEVTDEINNKEPDKLNIPFFDLGDDDVKSNF